MTFLMAIEDVECLVQPREPTAVLIIFLASILRTKILSSKIGGQHSKEESTG
jgi:hypothetical protein